MKKILCLIAVVLIVAGGVLMAATFPTMYAEMKNNDEYAEYSENLKNHYDSVEIHAVNADVTVTSAADSQPSVNAKTEPWIKVEVVSNGGTLVVKEVDQRKWYQRIGVFYQKPSKIEVNLADGVYSELNIKNTNGNITIQAEPETISFIEIRTNTINGETLINVPADWALSDSKNGDIRFIVFYNANQVSGMAGIVSGKTTNGDITDESIAAAKSFVTGNGKITSTGSFGMLHAKTVNGDIFLNRFSGDEVKIESVNGDITATTMVPMKYITSTRNGRVKVPEKTGNGTLEISTVNGDITVELAD